MTVDIYCYDCKKSMGFSLSKEPKGQFRCKECTDKWYKEHT